MTREVRKYFALVERLARFEPDDRTEPGKIHELMREGNAPRPQSKRLTDQILVVRKQRSRKRPLSIQRHPSGRWLRQNYAVR